MTVSIHQIHLTSHLTAKLTAAGDGSAPGALKESFLSYIQAGDSYEFGKDVGGGPKSHLRHVHMVPVSCPDALEKWKRDYENYTRCTSDRYLFYAVREPVISYLLIEHVFDPGAHEIWEPRNKRGLAAMEAIAEDFYIFNKIP